MDHHAAPGAEIAHHGVVGDGIATTRVADHHALGAGNSERSALSSAAHVRLAAGDELTRDDGGEPLPITGRALDAMATSRRAIFVVTRAVFTKAVIVCRSSRAGLLTSSPVSPVMR